MPLFLIGIIAMRLYSSPAVARDFRDLRVVLEILMFSKFAPVRATIGLALPIQVIRFGGVAVVADGADPR
jgi:hypothetical protein